MNYKHKALINKTNEDLWLKCDLCNNVFFIEEIKDNLKVCCFCNNHFKLRARERIDFTFDKGSFVEEGYEGEIKDYLSFSGYIDKLNKTQEKLDMMEAVITGTGYINGIKVVACIMDSYFMMGSMGNVVGEKITRSIEKATDEKVPLIIFTASGGARMQEGIIALMQMSKISAALKKFSNNNLLYITVLTHPTTGGVLASFGMLSDIILAEPNTLVGFAGKRVIKETINESLPKDFQSSEFVLNHGFIDKIIERKHMKSVLAKLLYMHERCHYGKYN
ncbi:acetyl-CoA carboxylase, carboxyltransferase subunit beta [Clostridium algidicarnis]|uniref:acetyl-CoA carboxylase, carboxyltransferase subunit beta n=1 Tax=Clostridium algidicarnis TaxID=37659 RepID=UPI001CF1F6FB|nr:acetyl-CoA carboxylase, carboxyltransferase subunit beta [Clostridium algidicarnis]MCB2287027.1 acetyl-CoA carboxylase, carboxyltransferase subunit beta [Clostridium algidicarnis]